MWVTKLRGLFIADYKFPTGVFVIVIQSADIFIYPTGINHLLFVFKFVFPTQIEKEKNYKRCQTSRLKVRVGICLSLLEKLIIYA